MRISKYISLGLLFLLIAIKGNAQTDIKFWFAAPDLQQSHGDRPIFLRIAASKIDASVTISIPANPGFIPISVSVAANSSQSVDLSTFIGLIENAAPNLVHQKGLLVSSTAPIDCYYDIANGYNGDIYVLKGKNALGKKFTIPMQMDFNNRTTINNTIYTADFIIVATEDNTNITINPKNGLVGRSGPFSITLNRGETFVCTSSSIFGPSKPGGTTIVSNKPIAVSTKDDSIALPGQACSDTVGDQILPDDLAGNEFIIVKGSLNISPDYYYVFATKDATTIKVNGSVATTINAGEYFTGKLTDISCYVETDKPSHVFHITGFGCELGGAVIPPIRCTGSSRVNITRASGNEEFYLTIIVPKEIINDFKINNDPVQLPVQLPASLFTAVTGNNNWMQTRVTVSSTFAVTNTNITLSNNTGKFHVGATQGGTATTSRYGFFSDFSSNTIVLKNQEDSTKELSDSTTLCNNTNARINAKNISADTYRWIGPNGFTSDSSMLIINPYKAKDTGLYTITTTGAGCGTASDSIRLFIDRPDAGFQFTTNGCAQDGVAFTTPASAGVRWVWDFGNGKKLDTSSALISPVVIGLAGDIPIKLKVVSTRGCFSDEVSKTIQLSPKPLPAYTIPNITCINTDVVFKDVSTIQSGTITKWRWNLDNGAGFKEYTENGDRVSLYTNFGPKNVRLVVESQTGCVSDTFRLNSFVVNPLPVPGYIIPEVCLDDAKAVFIDSTKSPDGFTGFSYKWNFNASAPSSLNGPTFTVANTTEKNPSIKYNAIGQYQVKLVVESRGCIDSITQFFKVYGTNPIPAFDVLAPDSLCGNDSVRIMNLSTIDFDNVTRLEIFWDDNNLALKTIDETPFVGKVYAFKYPDFQSPPTKTFNVTLRAFSGTASSCSKSITKKIKINASPKVAFSFVPGICLDAAPRQVTQASFDPIVPGTFAFTGKGVNNTGLFDPAAAGVGSHSIKYVYSSSASVCKDSASRNITVWPLPTADFKISSLNCEKNPIGFTSTAATAVGKLANWAWNFGDATPVVNALTAVLVSHTFAAYKKYDVSLVVTTDSGCVSMAKIIPLDVYALPRPVFSLPIVCLPEGKALFNNGTTIPDGSDNLLTYRWDFGDSRNTNTSLVKNGLYKYAAIGPYNVKLVATSTNNCKDSLVQQLTTVYEQPKARFASEDSLCIGDLLNCTDSSKTNNGVFNKWFWNFGDGATGVVKNPVHRYSTAAINTITFFAQTDLGCYTDTIKKQIEVFAYPFVSAGPDLFVLDDGQKQIKSTASGRIVSYGWTPSTYLNDTSILQPIIINPKDDIYYYLAVKGRGGCTSKDTLFVVSLSLPTPPNTFTPNGDGINDTWEIKYLDQYLGCRIEVYTTNGQLIYANDGYTKTWDGTYKGNAMPSGTYYFVIDPKNGRKKIGGYVVILR